MQTHDDRSHFINVLEERAEKMKGRSTITAGTDKEPVIAAWRAHGMSVMIRPDDPQEILRISVGGGNKTPVPLNYCTVRGDVEACIELLKRAIRALEASP